MSTEDAARESTRQEPGAGALGPPPPENANDPAQRRHEAAEDTAVPGDDLTGSLDEASHAEPPHR